MKSASIQRNGRLRSPYMAATYRQTQRLNWATRDSNSQWQAAAGEQVRIIGGVGIAPKALQPVKDQQILKRLPAAAREHVLVADLATVGLPSMPRWPTKLRGARKHPSYSSTINGCKSRSWPNATWASVSTIVDSGSTPRW